GQVDENNGNEREGAAQQSASDNGEVQARVGGWGYGDRRKSSDYKGAGQPTTRQTERSVRGEVDGEHKFYHDSGSGVSNHTTNSADDLVGGANRGIRTDRDPPNSGGSDRTAQATGGRSVSEGLSRQGGQVDGYRSEDHRNRAGQRTVVLPNTDRA